MKVIAVDFDNTITDGAYPPIAVNLPVVKWMRDAYDSEAPPLLVVYTARPQTHYTWIRHWLERNDVPYDSIECGKMRADVYLDDKAVHPDDIKSIGNPVSPPEEHAIGRPPGFVHEPLLKEKA